MSIAVPLYYRTKELISKPIISLEEFQELHNIVDYIEKTFDQVDNNDFHKKILLLFLIFNKTII